MMVDCAVSALNISLMFSIGLELEPKRIREAVGRGTLLGSATMLNFVAIPVLALGVGRVLGLEGGVLAGLLLAAVAPGGGTGTLLTRTARGSLELSVVLLGVFTLLSVPSVPLLTLFLLPRQGLEIWPLLNTLLVFQLVPLGLGVGLRTYRTRWANTALRGARPLSNALFAALVLGLLVTRGHLILEVGGAGLVGMMAVVVGSVAIPIALPLEWGDRMAVSLMTGVRNLSLALLVASAFLDDLTMLSVLVYGLIMYLVGVPFALWAGRRSTGDAQA